MHIFVELEKEGYWSSANGRIMKSTKLFETVSIITRTCLNRKFSNFVGLVPIGATFDEILCYN